MLPREKFYQWGVSSLNIRDLIAIIISTGTYNLDVLKVSSKVEKLLLSQNFNMESLTNIEGIGEIKAMKILCSTELGYRFACINKEKERITSTDQGVKHSLHISKKKQEYILAIFLNARYEILSKKIVSIGTTDRVNILPRDIIIPCLRHNASYIFLAHNHPSDNPSPSEGDILFTKRLVEGLSLVGITLLDHIIITPSGNWKNVALS